MRDESLLGVADVGLFLDCRWMSLSEIVEWIRMCRS